MDRRVTALEFDEHAHWRFIHRHHQVVSLELLAEFLVAKPDVQAQAFKHREQRDAIGDHGLVLFANLDYTR